jgi:membrane associated rhomboid family serine protease
MSRLDPRAILALGFVLVLLGAVLPFLMVMRIIQPTFALSFFSYAASIAGLFLGLIGAAFYTRKHKNRK